MTTSNQQVPQHDWAERTVSYATGIGRIMFGATLALAPHLIHRALGISYPGEDRGIWIKALGVRDIILGAAALHPDPRIRRTTQRSGIVIDMIDVAVMADGARLGFPRRPAVIGMLLASGTSVFAAFGPAALRSLRCP